MRFGLDNGAIRQCQQLFVCSVSFRAFLGGTNLFTKFEGAIASHHLWVLAFKNLLARCLWQKVLDARVESTVSPATIESAKEVVALLKSFTEVSADQVVHSDFESKMDDVSKFWELSKKLHGSSVEGALELAAEMDEAIQSFEKWVIDVLCPEYDKVLPCITSYCVQHGLGKPTNEENSKFYETLAGMLLGWDSDRLGS